MYQLKGPSVKAQSCSFGQDKSLPINIHVNGSHTSNSWVAVPANFQDSSQGIQTESTPTLSIAAPCLAMAPSARSDTTGQNMDTSPYSVQPHQSHTNYREYTRAAKTPIVTTKKVVGYTNTTQLFCSLPDDFGYSLRNFMVVDPVLDANALYARIAVRGGHAVVGHVCALPQQSLKPRNDSERTDQEIHKKIRYSA
ncbi:uncharacterized protein H6S33_003441 [Morchella sextelata]|uniref:uncharacterized protein n=1 Tax=Morchella sextelata TaxID=1174677 RepID=UPI001D0364A0|nr:uncharacterized protein H6S33_003441 [Morchella sextelata]KAH0606607.1 hypothetical protein H6S33_003441 [Morchella sextelata]